MTAADTLPLWLPATDALAMLKVRPQTLYANVSRGRIRTRPDAVDPRRSLYHRDDVQRLATRRQGRRSDAVLAGEAIQWGEPVLASGISTVVAGRLYYRGQDACVLAEEGTLEQVSALLWEGPAARFASSPMPAAPASSTAPLAGAMTALAGRAAADPPARGRGRPALLQEAAGLMGMLADALAGPSRGALVHERLAAAWRRPRAADTIRRALVLLADHELNASTFAARVTASTGASLAASVLSGLAALSGPLHGGAAHATLGLARAAAREGVDAALHEWLSLGRRLPAFGHPLYPQGDARAGALLAHVELPAPYAELRDAGERLMGEKANVDFALAALTTAHRLPPHAPLVLFALARAVGWIAHALEQQATGTLIRPRARYTGRAPGATAVH
ncbi:citrate synthase [uncultured Pseudacidovorax sp.]|uniref:citrate synthase n=1 Tax=uncultured Pseudacidovorax sp. TaxID=679313 RepID=UPI0025DF87B9|nr:citrate synthase [uncultured Pseudacidovorax sp.]